MTLLNQNDLARRWAMDGVPVSDRTVRRTISDFGLKPHRVSGQQPFYALSDVLKMERKRDAVRLRRWRRVGQAVARANRARANGLKEAA